MVPLEEIQDATRRLLRTVDQMPDPDYETPSLLPDWSRAHVVAHLILNAEGLAGALAGVVRGRPIPMYASQEDRDGDIEELADATPATLRTRLLGACTEFAGALSAVPDDSWGVEIERTPGGSQFPAGAVPGMREREVEIHHVDLGTTYSRDDWPASFCDRLLAYVCSVPRPRPFTVRATDLDREWPCGDGDGGPTISGFAADLGWWLTGRGDGSRLTSNDGSVPRIEAW